MSFSSDIKERLCRAERECPSCAAAELAGMLRFAGSAAEDKIKFTTENETVFNRLCENLRECFGIDAGGEKKVKYRFETKNTDEAENITEGMAGSVKLSCCRAAYVRGAFLRAGSVSNPEKSYHLEFDTKNKKEAEFLRGVLAKEGFSSKLTYRKGYNVVYVKESDTIAAILGFMGAGRSALELFTIQIEKEVRNSINRRVNCDTANADKSARASSKHIYAIKKLKNNGQWVKLPEVLREIAELRLEYPEDSLKELGEKTNPPIGKSGVNHRLNRILAIAENL